MARKLLTLLGVYVCVILMVKCGPVDEWQLWKHKYDKQYDNIDDETEHRQIWLRNYDLVQKHNEDPERAFTMEMNTLADQVIRRPQLSVPLDHYVDDEDTGQLMFAPASWDWRGKGAVGPVKNQGSLGDVVAISAEECVESYKAIQTGRLVMYSAAEVHDCCSRNPIPSTVGVFDCIHNIGGICVESQYPQSVGKCMNNSCTDRGQISGSNAVAEGDEAGMMAAVYKTPVLALIDASHASFQLYRSGIYSDRACSSKRLDHSLQVVGYGSQDGEDYWICRNSWGVNWGMQGYILIARNKNNMCGIASMTSYPV